MKTFSVQLLLLLALLLAGCKQPDFQLVFTMENMKIYKISIEITGDKSYRIQQQNLYFDRHAKKAQVNKSEGKMTNREFKELTKLINDCQLFEMKSTYGFDETSNPDEDPLDGVLYRLNYTENDKSKYMLIHPTLADTYPESLSRLIGFLNNYSSAHLNK